MTPSTGDQRETFLLRLLHASGTHGLAGMPEAAPFPAPSATPGRLTLVRPLLGLEKSDLEGLLHEQGVPFVVDPSNANDKYHRNRVRRLLAGAGGDVLAAMDRVRARCALVAGERLAMGGAALRLSEERAGAAMAARETGRPCPEALVLHAPTLAAAGPALRTAVALALARCGGGAFSPGAAGLDGLVARLASGRLAGAWTGGGCVVRPLPKSKGRLVTVTPQQ